MKVAVQSSRYVRCPGGCTHRFSVEHLFEPDMLGRECGPWYCDDCNRAWHPTAHADGTVDMREGKSDRADAFVVLELPPRPKPIRLLLATHTYSDDDEDLRFHYEESTCPTNWLPRVAEVVVDRDEDPHGLCTFVRCYRAGTPEAAKLRALVKSETTDANPEGWVDLVAAFDPKVN